MPAHGRIHTIIFTIVLGVVCSGLLKAIDAHLSDRIALNRRLDRTLNVLLVLGVPLPERASPAELERIYRNCVEEVPAPDGGILYYRCVDRNTGKTVAYAFPLQGMGLWDKINGLMAVETDLTTIRGVSFYDQQETPGLGGRIGEPEFTAKFKGKKIVNGVLRVIKPGAAPAENEIDGITGATLTCERVEELMNRGVKRFLENVRK